MSAANPTGGQRRILFQPDRNRCQEMYLDGFSADEIAGEMLVSLHRVRIVLRATGMLAPMYRRVHLDNRKIRLRK
jgi:hypothetical protein